MKFNELNENNYIMFAIKHYDNPQAVTEDDFYEDMKRFKWIKRLLNKYKNSGVLNVHLLLNHFIILYNVLVRKQLLCCSIRLTKIFGLS